jgi:hypothetical protein
MNEPTASKLTDADMQAVPAVLRRASERAREAALRSGTPLIVVRSGVLLRLDPETEEQSASSDDRIHDRA